MAVVFLGPSGGTDGAPFQDDEIPVVSRVRVVRGAAGRLLDRIQIEHELPNGDILPLDTHGGGGGAPFDFPLDRDEHIQAIRGRYGAAVDSIEIITNTGNRRGPFGRGEGRGTYQYEAPPGAEIVGFTGRSGRHGDDDNVIVAIGVVLRRLT
jgi:jacalin-like lectin domain-containing protein